MSIVEHDDHVRFEREGGVITMSQGVGNNVTHSSMTFAGPVVIGVILGRVPGGVFDMDVDDVIADVLPKFPGILLGPRFRLGAIRVEDGIGGIEYPFKAGTFIE